MGKIKRSWKYVEGPEAAQAFSGFAGPKADEMQRKVLDLERMKEGVPLKGNLFEPVAVAEYPGYPLHLPVALLAFPDRRLEFGMHIIEPGYGFPVHVHDYGDEVYLVVKGCGKLILDEQEFDAKPFDIFYIPSGLWHTGYNPEENEEDFYLCIVHAPPMSFKMRAMGWELTESMWTQLGYPKPE